MDPSLIAAFGAIGVVVVVLTLTGVLLVQEHMAAAAEVKARGQGLNIGSEAVDKVVGGQVAQVQGQMDSDKQRDPVAVANDLIDGAKKP